MYLSPRHPDYGKPQPVEPPRRAPEPSGQILATFSRPGGRFGPPTELRCSLDEYEGHEFINLRVWTSGPDGNWYPTRKGVSIKLREAADLAAALTEAVRLAGDGGVPQQQQQRRAGPELRRGPAGGGRQPGLPVSRQAAAAGGWHQDFDEVDGPNG